MWMILKGLLVLLATTSALACGRGSSPRTVGIPLSASQLQPVSMAQAPTGSDGTNPVGAPRDAETSGGAATDARVTSNPQENWGRLMRWDHPVPDDKTGDPPRRRSLPLGSVRIAVPRARGDCANGAVRNRLRVRAASIRACYEYAMYSKPKLAGRLVLSLRQTNADPNEANSRIYRDAVTCSVLRNTVQDAPMAACVCRVIERAKLPWSASARAPFDCAVEAAFDFSRLN